MSLPENDYQILKLTDDFYDIYSNPPYVEIMKKRQRAYTCILEYNETMMYLEKVKCEALKYVEDYIAHMKGQNMLHPREFKRRYEFSSLKYFHVEMGI